MRILYKASAIIHTEKTRVKFTKIKKLIFINMLYKNKLFFINREKK